MSEIRHDEHGAGYRVGDEFIAYREAERIRVAASFDRRWILFGFIAAVKIAAIMCG